jgi:hypothetical protein
MMIKHISIVLLAAFALSLPNAEAQSPTPPQEGELTAEQLKFFETHIRPVLIKECYSCHSTKTGNAKGGLRLDSQQLMHLGGSSGPAIVPGDTEASLLFNAISYQDFAMPPKGPLPPEIVTNFRKWIEMGAPDPRRTDAAKVNSQITDADIKQAKAEFWAYRKPAQPLVPKITSLSGSNNADTAATPQAAAPWVRSDIDRFILAGLKEAGLTPSPDAEPRQLLRRLSYDLIGLPPTPQQTDAFVRQWSRDPDRAIAATVDRLLDSPQFGERWGRHWLDLARYAESNGREVNMTFPQAWRYRDYVIDSFNKDKPYDRFVQEQIAGDLLPVKTDEQWAENLVATTFLAIGPKSLSEQNRVQFTADLVDEQIDATTRVILGTSVACARCHDHKFDPIPQSDYYAMAGIFGSTQAYYGVPASQFGALGGIQNRNTTSLMMLPIEDPNPFDRHYTKDELAAMVTEIREARQELVESRQTMRRDAGNPNVTNRPQVPIQNLIRLQNRIEVLSSVLGSVDENGKPITFCMGVQDKDKPSDAKLLVRGEIDQPAQTVKRDFPQVLRDQPANIPAGASGRLELARWLTSADNPLTARVMVNRIWQHLLGHGIVRSTEDFGSTGQAPSHPELLDHLAIEFVDSGWSIKSMIRQIANSRVYRLSNAFDEAKFLEDPDNQWLWRASPRRLDAEALRDSMLFVSGQLELARPRASEVAKAGYMQVRDGNLVNLNQIAAMGSAMASSSMTNMNGEARMDGMAGAAGGDPLTNARQQFARQMMRQDPAGFARTLRNARSGIERVDMVEASFRSVYLPILRDELPRSLEVFDLAEPSMVIGARESSNTPNQALYLLNNEFVLRQSETLATQVLEETRSVSEQIDQAFLRVLGRQPSKQEREASSKFMAEFSGSSRYRGQALLTLSALCQSLMASAEFRYLP